MKHDDKNNIDELFREGLSTETYPVAFGESDWPKLEQRLDRYYKIRGAVSLLKPLIGIAALLLLAFSVWLLWPEKEQPSSPQRAVQSEEQKKEPQQPSEVQPAQPPEEKQTEVVTVPDSSEASAQTEPAREFPAGKSGRRVTAGEPGREFLVDKSAARESAEKAVAGIDGIAVAIPDTLKTLPGAIVVSDDRGMSLPDSVKLSEKHVAEGREPIHIEYVPVPDNVVIPKPPPRAMALSVLVAPSYSGTGNLNNLDAGGDVGVMFALGLSGRLSFSTGAVYAKKIYNTSYGSGYDAQMVNADCRVLDVPLNVNYALIRKENTLVSIGTGISSWFMLREVYRYPDSDLPDVRLVNENQHWLSVVNFQANYERRLSRRVSINVQPYMKIPVADIGYARVRLQSLGMALGVSWNFNR